MENLPALWIGHFPAPDRDSHKYSRGHTIIPGGEEMTGAARLAAMAALRIGSGLVSVLCSAGSFPIYAGALTSVMVRRIGADGIRPWLADDRVTAAVFGPGAGAGESTRERVIEILAARKPVVLDADALTSFADDPDALLTAIQNPAILTPHSGEFTHLFGYYSESAKREATQDAAKLAAAVVVHKGAETVIASPDGRVAINRNAPPWLATAGSGDVLAGLCGGLLAQGMPAFEAACAAVWIHGDAASRFGGIGLIAEDLPELVPEVLCELLRHPEEE